MTVSASAPRTIPSTDQVRLQPGDTAPTFTLPAVGGESVSLQSLRGRKVILYFYPAANTPACTTEACDFRDNLASLSSDGFVVLGISKDDLPALDTFAAEQRLDFPLLADPSLNVHKRYGAYGEKNSYGRTIVGTIRSTFVLDERGTIILALYNVKAKGHVAMLRRKINKALASPSSRRSLAS